MNEDQVETRVVDGEIWNQRSRHLPVILRKETLEVHFLEIWYYHDLFMYFSSDTPLGVLRQKRLFCKHNLRSYSKEIDYIISVGGRYTNHVTPYNDGLFSFTVKVTVGRFNKPLFSFKR